MRDHGKHPPYDQPAQRRRACEFQLHGTGAQDLKYLRERIKRGAGVCRYVYRAHARARSVTIANHEIVELRSDLVGVYDSRVTAAMLRADLFHQDPSEIPPSMRRGA